MTCFLIGAKSNPRSADVIQKILLQRSQIPSHSYTPLSHSGVIIFHCRSSDILVQLQLHDSWFNRPWRWQFTFLVSSVSWASSLSISAPSCSSSIATCPSYQPCRYFCIDRNVVLTYSRRCFLIIFIRIDYNFTYKWMDTNDGLPLLLLLTHSIWLTWPGLGLEK